MGWVGHPAMGTSGKAWLPTCCCERVCAGWRFPRLEGDAGCGSCGHGALAVFQARLWAFPPVRSDSVSRLECETLQSVTISVLVPVLPASSPSAGLFHLPSLLSCVTPSQGHSPAAPLPSQATLPLPLSLPRWLYPQNFPLLPFYRLGD